PCATSRPSPYPTLFRAKRLLSRTRGPYPTADGHLCLVVYTDKHWRDFLRLMGKSELLDTDPRFHDQESRTQNAEFIGQFLAEHLDRKSTRLNSSHVKRS